VCTPACLLAASISVEAVTPPLWDEPFKELLPIYYEEDGSQHEIR
jgi:hypothetical protein